MDGFSSFQEEFLNRYHDPASLHALLGMPGYSLPPLEGLSWHPMPGNGKNNWILADRPNVDYTFNVESGCNNNVLVIHKGAKCAGHLFIRGSNNSAILYGSEWGHHPISVHFHSSRHVFFWGAGCTSNTVGFEMGTDGTCVIVGEDCMFSAFIGGATDDSHAMIDLTNGKQLNPAADIVIEPHVWVGMSAQIRKGVTIGFGSIVGGGSTVTRDVPRKCCVAGSPAKQTRTGVSWVRHRFANNESLQFITELERQFGFSDL